LASHPRFPAVAPLLAAMATVLLVLASSSPLTAGEPAYLRLLEGPREKSPEALDRPEPSAMGALFMGLTETPRWITERAGFAPLPYPGLAPFGQASDDVNVTPGVDRFQSETSIAVYDDSVVVGFNDITGFFNPSGISVSGYAWSHDGGNTFTYGGQLPVLGTGDAVRGDPDVKVWVDPATQRATWVYSSIYFTDYGQYSLCVHVSTDGGVTWSPPREAAVVSSPSDFADKEFIDVDPETGRVLLSWTSFGAAVEMSTTWSDDFGLTWAPVTVFSARPEDGQGSCPRFDPTSEKAYIVWRNFASPSSISFVRSLDNGNTWTAPANVITGVNTPLPPYGSDRINGFPALEVAPTSGDLHLVYASLQTADFGDVYYSVSRDSGDTWSGPVTLNADPGNDRAQFFPWVAVHENGSGTEVLDAVWYDQRSGTEGSDLTEVVHAHSPDAGMTWTSPVPFLPKPFHAEYGQDTGQPNIGDYNQCVAQAGIVYASYARTDVADYQTLAPDTYVGTNANADAAAPFHLEGVSVGTPSGCRADTMLVAGEVADLDVTLKSDHSGPLSGISASLATGTPGVTILDSNVPFGNAGALGTSQNTGSMRVFLDPSFACGDAVPFRLTGTSSEGPFTLDFEIPTGVVEKDSVLVDEDFDGVVSGLPAGWAHVQRKGVSNPWGVSPVLSVSGPNSVFCADRPDTNWSRLDSPSFPVPAWADLLEVTFEVTYDNEAVGNGRQGWDGSLLKIRVDGTDVLAGAFSTLFEGQYRTQLVRGSGSLANPLQDLSAWTGNTLPGFESIRIHYPGLAGRTVSLAFEMGSDGFVGATGTYVDDVLVRAIDLGCGTCDLFPALAVAPGDVAFPPAPVSATTCTTVTVHNTGDGLMEVLSVSGCDAGDFSLDISGLDTYVLPHDSTAFEICWTPSDTGPDTCSAVVETNAGSDTVEVHGEVSTAAAGGAVPRALRVESVLPNPFNPHARIRFALPEAGPVWVTIYDTSGRRVRRLLQGVRRAAGPGEATWNGTDDAGAQAASGVYFVQVRTEEESRVVKAVLVR
jgi:hypothetical protein